MSERRRAVERCAVQPVGALLSVSVAFACVLRRVRVAHHAWNREGAPAADAVPAARVLTSDVSVLLLTDVCVL